MKCNPFTLAFTREWADLEPLFQHAYFRESLTRIRAAIAAGVFLYAVFGALDAVMVPEKKETFWLIRYAVVLPMAIAVFAYSFRRGFERWYNILLFALCLTAGLGIEVMVMLAPPPASYSYYAGIILVFIITQTFFRMGVLWASAATLIILMVYEVISVWVIHTPTHILINNNFFFISSAFLCILAGYSIEYNARQRFFASHLLSLEKEKVNAANQTLDSQVRTRTRELSRANQRLQREMTERLAAQKSRLELEKALSKRQKLESIGTLAGGIAHDFNNILGAIIGYTELIAHDTKENDTAENAGEVLRAAMRAKELTAQILTFSRQNEQALVPIEIAPVVEEALKLIRASIPSTIEIDARIRSGAWVVSGATQIHRIIINLCTNAVQAMPDQAGRIRVILEDAEHDPAPGAGNACVRLTVSDTGQGMTEAVMSQIFDPFFTTRGPDQGTGMGLSVIHGIVKKAKGRIRVDSTPGQGTTFTILLPRVPPGPPPSSSPDIGTARTGRGQYVLVLDDEPPLLRLLETSLPEFGYKVTGFADPGEALDHVRTGYGDLDLVITDFSMPGMNGLEFSRQVKQIAPDLPVILCTGYSENLTREAMADAGIDDFLMKPLTRKTVRDRIHTLLTRSEGTRGSGTGQKLGDQDAGADADQDQSAQDLHALAEQGAQPFPQEDGPQ